MKIATWNLERGRTLRAPCPLQEETIQALAADVLVLTEPSVFYQRGPAVVTSPAQREGPRGYEAWVAVVGSAVEPVDFDVPFERLSVAAQTTIAGRTVIVYGAVLPWLSVKHHAPYVARTGENALEVFERLLAEQAADVAELRRRHDAPVIWAGDFNQSLLGPNLAGSAVRRTALAKTLAELGLTAWNEAAAHAQPGMCTIDLICGPKECTLRRHGRIDPVSRGVVMSDHAGYWVEL